MLIRRPAGLSLTGIGLALLIGTVSGVYIWQPYLIEAKKKRNERLILAHEKKADKEEPAS